MKVTMNNNLVIFSRDIDWLQDVVNIKNKVLIMMIHVDYDYCRKKIT